MIKFEIGADTNGTDYARVAGHEARSLGAAARHLVSEGEPDQPWEAAWLGRPVSMRGRSLHGLACLATQDTDHGLRWGFWQPYPGSPVAPALAQVVADAKQARALVRDAPISASTPSPRQDSGADAKAAGGASHEVCEGMR